MELEESKSLRTLIRDLCSNVWSTEYDSSEKSNEPNREQPENVKKKLLSSCFNVLLKQKHLWTDKQQSNGEITISYRLFLYFYKKGHCNENDKVLLNDYCHRVENLVKKYEAAEAVFTFLAAMSESKPRKKIKPNEMLSCFHFGTLKHCVPPHQRSQTIQDQFEMLRSEENDTSVFPTTSQTNLNPFRVQRHFDFNVTPILIQAPALNSNVPRFLNIVKSTSQPVQQDEGYGTPDCANVLEEAGGQSDDYKKHWPQFPEVERPCPPSWNTLGNANAPEEKSFALDFDLATNSDRTGKHLMQVIQSGKDAPDPSNTRLFTHERGREEFTRDLKYLLVGTPSQCFPFHEDKKQFTCAYGIYTAHVSPDFLFKFLEPALQCGNYAYMLKHLPRDKKKGYIYLSFLNCVREYLRRYDTQVLSHLSEHTSWAYIELQDFVTAQCHRLSCLAHLWQPTTHLLNHIYAQTLAACVTSQSPELVVMVARIFETCTNTHFELLEKWLFQGACHEALVSQSSCHSLKSRLFWARGFRFNQAQSPQFLADYEEKIFACGKNICLLKLTNLEDPLFSVDFRLVPRLRCYLTKESLAEFHARCRQYESAVVAASGGEPQLGQLLVPREYSQAQLRQWQEQARAQRELHIQRLQDERLKKRELQAEQRRKMRLEIETIEQRKREEREKEVEADLRIMAEARRMDEAHWRVKEEEKRKIEEYYRSLMRMIEKRHEHVKSKTQSLEEMKTLLRRKVSRDRQSGDTTDGKLESKSSSSTSCSPPHSETSLPDTPSPTSPSSSASSVPSASSLPSSSEAACDPDLFTLDIPEPPNVELLIQKIEEEEEAILLTRETQKRLDHLKCNRLQARANRNKVLSCEYDICTGEAMAKPGEPFDLKEKYMEGNSAHAHEEAMDNKARAQGAEMSDCFRGSPPGTSSGTVELEKNRNQGRKKSRRDKTEVQCSTEKSKTEEMSKGTNVLDARQSALLIKQKILSAEFDIDMNRSTRDTKDSTTCDIADGTTRETKDSTTRDTTDSATRGDACRTRESSEGRTRKGSSPTKKVLTAHEEAMRNKTKVMSAEFHMKTSLHKAGTDDAGKSDPSSSNQEAKRNRQRSCSGSDMGYCLRNDGRPELSHDEESTTGLNEEARQNRDRSRAGRDMEHCMRNDGRAATYTEESTTGLNEEARQNRDRSRAGRDMEHCMRNDGKAVTYIEESNSSGVNQEARQNRDRSRGGRDVGHCMRNDGKAEATSTQVPVTATRSDLTEALQEEDPTTEPTDDVTSSHSMTSSSENLVTVISRPNGGDDASQASDSKPGGRLCSSDIVFTRTIRSVNSEYNINPAWSFDSLVEENQELDVTLVQKYLEQSISVPLCIQYRLTNQAVLRLFLHKHHLASHLITLRNYFFLLDGAFARSLTRDLSRQIRSNLLLLLNPFKLNSILRKAVSYGTCDTKMQNNLTFVVRNIDTISSLQESNVFQYISLSYKVDWPLNIVLTPEALANYDKVFVFLMQVQQVSHTLQQVFVYLKLRRHLEVNNLYIYRQINLFRHVMMQVLSAVQNYIHCSVLELPWQEMVEDFKKHVTLDSVYYRHVEYVKQIRFRCLLNNRSRPLTEALAALFRTILDFYEELKRRSPERNYENLLAIFQRFLKISLYFHDYCKRMVVKGYQEQNLDYLLHMLSLNDYFSRAIQ